MVKFGKNKFKALNKLAKKQNTSPTSNKVIRKKLNAEKKVSFQKEVLLQQAFKSDGFVKNIRTTKVLQKKSKAMERVESNQDEHVKKKIKSVEKQKKRQKTQISDTKLLLNLMKKK